MKLLRVSGGDANACQQICFLEAQIHERNGERSIPVASCALDNSAERFAVVASLFRIGLFMQSEIGAYGHAQATGGEIEVKIAIRQAASPASRTLTRPTAPLAFSL